MWDRKDWWNAECVKSKKLTTDCTCACMFMFVWACMCIRVFSHGILIMTWDYNIRRNANSDFAIVTILIVANFFFWNGSAKKSYAEVLVARHFIIISLCKNFAWLQKFYISIELLKWNMFNRRYCQKANL